MFHLQVLSVRLCPTVGVSLRSVRQVALRLRLTRQAWEKGQKRRWLNSQCLAGPPFLGRARKCPLPFLACRKEAPLPCDIPCQEMVKTAEVAIFARLHSSVQASPCSVCLGCLSVSTRNDDNKQSRTCLVSGAILEGVEPCRHTTTFTLFLANACAQKL